MKPQRNPISPRQVKTIHTIVSKVGMEDGDYRLLLRERFQVTSSKKLTWQQAEELIDELNGKTGSPSPSALSQGARGPKKWAELDGRPGFASGGQCRLIEAMWSQVSRTEDPAQRETAMFNFLFRILKVSHFRFLRGWMVEKVVRALEGMGARKPERKGATETQRHGGKGDA